MHSSKTTINHSPYYLEIQHDLQALTTMKKPTNLFLLLERRISHFRSTKLGKVHFIYILMIKMVTISIVELKICSAKA